uniref:Outer membrane protein assembly factor BamE n=1 Tax=Candidatus Kentrum sp. TUN TaxID=2126343 RepID=A0A450ZAV6_9GAMM|nr:MAG: Beta-barrel assembly machine subunit BamE [Candidatus Kentron sp. TUN]
MTTKRNIMRLPARNNSVGRPAWYRLLAIGVAAALIGCDGVKFPSVKIPDVGLSNIVYKVDVQQGNVVTQEMLDKLKQGMDKRRVRFILGTPLIVSAFNRDRWDYVYSFQSGSGDREQYRLSLFFEEDKLQYIEGNVAKATRKGQVPLLKEDTSLTIPAADSRN